MLNDVLKDAWALGQMTRAPGIGEGASDRGNNSAEAQRETTGVCRELQACGIPEA